MTRYGFTQRTLLSENVYIINDNRSICFKPRLYSQEKNINIDHSTNYNDKKFHSITKK